MNSRLPGSERGSALLVVALLGAATVASSAALLERARTVTAELRARRDVLCARYGAAGGLALGASAPPDERAAALLIGPDVDSLVVRFVARSPSWCVVRSRAVCGDAQRTLERTAADDAACDAAPP